MKKIFVGREMPFEHLPKGLKLPKMPLPSELNHIVEDEQNGESDDNKSEKKEDSNEKGDFR
jgi:hypothetical protein